MAQQLYEQWFRIADADKDGAVGGGEAVSFFMRSGLPQGVLGQIWELASSGAAKLNQIQFSSAMRLVALAQARNGQLPLDQARAVIAGVGPSLPPPRLQGLETAGGPAPTAATAMPGAPMPGAATPPYGAPAPVVPPYTAQPPGAVAAYPAAPTTGVRPIGTPGIVGPAAPITTPVGAPASAPAAGAFPPLSAAELQRIQGSFLQLDTDRDGYVTGAECFGFFTQSGLDKAVLRDIWTLVAGDDASRLSGPQFVASLYLIDLARRGMPMPKYLPPGLAGFPPVAAAAPAAAVAPAAPPASSPSPVMPAVGPAVAAAPVTVAARAPAPTPTAAPAPAPSTATWSLENQFGTSSNILAVLSHPPVMSAVAAPPPPPAMPAKMDLSTGERLAAPIQHVSHVPQVSPALLAGVSAMDRTKLQEEQQKCEANERAVQTAEDRAAEARARQAQLTTALQELVVFRNRTEVALLTSQDQARRLEEEVEATRKRYDKGYAEAQIASEKSAAVHAKIMQLVGQKAELEDKLRRLEGEVAAAAQLGPADVARLEGELAELNSKCAAMEAARNAKMAKVDGIRRQQETARAHLAELQRADLDAAAEVEACQSSLGAMEAELKDARASGSLSALPVLLSRAATVYRGLYGLAHRAGTAVPFEALPATLEGLHVWADEVAAGVIDWPDDDVDARGFIVVNALPGADAPRPILKPAAAKAAEVKPAPAKPAAAAPAAAAPVPRMLPDDFAAPVGQGSVHGSGGFDDPPAFGDAPAFAAKDGSGDAPTAPAPVAAAAAAAAPTAPEGFGFADPQPPAAAPAAAEAAVAPTMPDAAPAAPALDGFTSYTVSPQGSNAFAPAAEPSQAGRVGSAFSFGEGGSGALETDTPKVVSSGPSHSAAEASADFGDNAFAVPAAAAATASASSQPPLAFGDVAFLAVPHSSTATVEAAPAAAGTLAAHGMVAAAAAGTSSWFGDDAFGGSQGFGSGPLASAAHSGHGPAAAAAAAPVADSPASSLGGAAPPLPGADSGALETNPFAMGSPPALAAALPGSGAGSADHAASTASATPPQPAAPAAVAFFDDNAFGAASSAAAAAAAPAAAASQPPPPQPHQASAAAPPASSPAPARFGFEDENPFGDADNPFGAPPAFR